jgi:hypothetical protein
MKWIHLGYYFNTRSSTDSVYVVKETSKSWDMET